jgi:hypothetical protein
VEDRRGQVLGSFVALAGVAGTLVALVKDGWLRDLLIVVLVVAGVGVVAVLVSYGRSWYQDRRLKSQPPPEEPKRVPAPLSTNRWRYTTEGAEAINAMNAFNKGVSHPGYMQAHDEERSKVVVSVLVPCDPLTDAPPTSALVKAFLELLRGHAVMSLASTLGLSVKGLSWYSYGSNGVLNNQAILAPSADDKAAPAASAILNLNDSSVRYQHFQDPGLAELILRFEPSLARSLTLAQVYELLLGVLNVPDSLGRFLSEDVKVSTYADQAVQVGVCLEGNQYLTDLVDPGDVVSPPGLGRGKQYLIYLLGEPSGKRKGVAVIDALRGLCDYGLHVQGYEDQLDALTS